MRDECYNKHCANAEPSGTGAGSVTRSRNNMLFANNCTSTGLCSQMNVESSANGGKITVANPTQTCDEAGKNYAPVCVRVRVWVEILSAPISACMQFRTHTRNLKQGLIDPNWRTPARR